MYIVNINKTFAKGHRPQIHIWHCYSTRSSIYSTCMPLISWMQHALFLRHRLFRFYHTIALIWHWHAERWSNASEISKTPSGAALNSLEKTDGPLFDRLLQMLQAMVSGKWASWIRGHKVNWQLMIPYNLYYRTPTNRCHQIKIDL